MSLVLPISEYTAKSKTQIAGSITAFLKWGRFFDVNLYSNTAPAL